MISPWRRRRIFARVGHAGCTAQSRRSLDANAASHAALLSTRNQRLRTQRSTDGARTCRRHPERSCRHRTPLKPRSSQVARARLDACRSRRTPPRPSRTGAGASFGPSSDLGPPVAG
jgi:hypothetical protein